MKARQRIDVITIAAPRSAAQGRTDHAVNQRRGPSRFPLAWILPPDRTVEFVREVDVALAGHPVRGEGLAHRVAVELLPRFFVPPPMLKQQLEHVNIRLPCLDVVRETGHVLGLCAADIPGARRWRSTFSSSLVTNRASSHMREQRLRRTRRVEVISPRFPAYAFVVIERQWHSARWSIGVTAIIMDGDHPARVPEPIIAGIRRARGSRRGRAAAAAGHADRPARARQGGPFAGFNPGCMPV